MTRSLRLSRYAVIRHGSGLLLVLDAHSHLWGFPGGGMQAGESGYQTLARELSEEVGPVALLSATLVRTEGLDDRVVEYWRVMCNGYLRIRDIEPEILAVRFVTLAQMYAMRRRMAPGVIDMAEAVLDNDSSR